MGASIFFTAAMTNMYAPMLTRVWQELEYRIDVCRVTRGAQSNISSCKKKTFQFSCGCEQFH
jgi:predicted SprT family Zn-dependent metalloprotease